jgi:hypothetical protein
MDLVLRHILSTWKLLLHPVKHLRLAQCWYKRYPYEGSKHETRLCAFRVKLDFFFWSEDRKVHECVSCSEVFGYSHSDSQRWVNQYNVCSNGIFESYKKVGRKCVLTEEHKTTAINFIDATVVEVTEHLSTQFHDLKVSRSIVYNFIRSKYNLLLKKLARYYTLSSKNDSIVVHHNRCKC